MYARVPQLVNHVHLPVQHGSDRILMAMKRGYTAMEFKSTVKKLRAVRPDICIGSDFIVGFPGETEEDFGKLMKLVDDVGFDASFSFVFSARPGTPAAALPDDTPQAVKLDPPAPAAGGAGSERAAHQRVAPGHTPARAGGRRVAQGCDGTDRAHRVQPHGQLQGAPRLIGQMVDLEITAVNPHSLRGEVWLNESALA